MKWIFGGHLIVSTVYQLNLLDVYHGKREVFEDKLNVHPQIYRWMSYLPGLHLESCFRNGFTANGMG